MTTTPLMTLLIGNAMWATQRARQAARAPSEFEATKAMPLEVVLHPEPRAMVYKTADCPSPAHPKLPPELLDVIAVPPCVQLLLSPLLSSRPALLLVSSTRQLKTPMGE